MSMPCAAAFRLDCDSEKSQSHRHRLRNRSFVPIPLRLNHLTQFFRNVEINEIQPVVLQVYISLLAYDRTDLSGRSNLGFGNNIHANIGFF